ncbi:MAG: DnaD domain protein, partial [Lachnospiraceae bacterium]
ALKYWEKCHLLSLDYDDTKTLVGVHFKNLSQPAEPVSRTEVSVSPSPSSTDSPENRYAKPTYSLDQLKAFKAQEEAEQILFIAEQYLGKTLSPNEIKSILFFYDRLGFSTDLIDYLIQYCVGRDKKDFRYIEKVAISWAESNITTPKQAAAIAHKYDKTVYTIMAALGKSSAPIGKEVDYIVKWTKTYAFSLEIILEACNRTVLAVDAHRFEYADGILSNWFKNNVHRLDDIKTADANYKKSKVTLGVATNSFNQFQQNDYDFDEIERKLLRN